MKPSPIERSRTSPPVPAAVFLLALLIGAPSCAKAAFPTDVTVRDFFEIPFDHPVVIAEFPGTDSTYLVIELNGAILRVEWQDDAWVTSLFDSIPVQTGDENGLMGFAFHPAYAENGKYYVFYVLPPAPGIIRLAERTADSSRLKGSGLPERPLIILEKPYLWHNGGTLAFGADGYLYTAIGDGGGGADPENRAQNPGELHGKFLRIDVDGPDAFPDDSTRNYAIPPGNPFIDNPAYLPEIWAIGLRSPWKWTFHPETGEIWLGDVGQIMREKVTLVPKGANLGWRMWEGTHCYWGPCEWTGMTLPVLDLPREISRSVIGGVFHQGSPTSPFHDAYIFGDYVTHKLWAMRAPGGAFLEYAQVGTIERVTSFNLDSRGRIFATAFSPGPGRIFILESPDLEHGPVRLAASRGRVAASITRADLIRNRDRYVIRSLDGRKIHGMPGSGTFLVSDKESRLTPRPSPRLLRLD